MEIKLFSGNLNNAQGAVFFAITAIVLLLFVFLSAKLLKEIIINSLLGFGLVLVLKTLGLWNFTMSLAIYVLVIFGGVPGVLLVYILHFLNIKI